jgi:hypothetical protein
MAKEVQATVDLTKMILHLDVPIDEERISTSGKSILVYSSAFSFTKIKGTSLMYKLIIIRDIHSDSIIQEES